MMLPRVYSLGRVFFSRRSTRMANSVFLARRIPTPFRSFASTPRFAQGTIQQEESESSNIITPASPASVPEEVQRKNARSVQVFMVPNRATRREIEALFRNAGFDVADVSMSLDRFRWENNTYATVELADEQQAQRAIKELNLSDALGRKIILNSLKPDFIWDYPFKEYAPSVPYNEIGLRKAVQPILENRRIHVSVTTPTWANEHPKEQRSQTEKAVIERTFSRFGIESISRVNTAFAKGKAVVYLCLIDFTTKEGADEAMRAINDTNVEGVRVWTKRSELDSLKALLIGKASKALLIELQEKGLAPQDSEIEDWASKNPEKDPRKSKRQRKSKIVKVPQEKTTE